MKALEVAFERRKHFADASCLLHTNGYRLFCGEKEGIPGLVIDRYDQAVVLIFFTGQCRLSEIQLREIAEWCVRQPGITSAYLKGFIADRTGSTADPSLFDATPVAGGAMPSEVVIRESGLSYRIRLYDGFSTGLFLDQRENRRYLARKAAGKRVLNCFSYTCGFSLSAASAGAETTSIDLSKRYLEWGKENFALNGIAADKHRFLERDATAFLKKSIKRQERYDLIIVDPPSFSRTKQGVVFSLKKDFPDLLTDAYLAVEVGGHLFFSCNFAGWSSSVIKSSAQRILPRHTANWNFEELPSAPDDFRYESNPLSSLLIKKERD